MAIQEVTNIFDSLTQFFKDKQDYLTGGSTYPDIGDISSLEYPELLTFISKQTSGPAGFEVGAAQEAMLTAESISREIDMAKFSKSAIYDSCAQEAIDDAKFYNSSGAFFSGILIGNSSNGSRS